MNKKLIEYLIIATAIVILIYSCYAFMTYDYGKLERHTNVTDSITVNHPSSSEFNVVGDTIVFKNSLYDFYNMNISKLNSSNERLTNLLNHFASVNKGTIDYKNETCYVLTMEFDDGSGFKYHSMIIPIDSFNKDNLTFTKETNAYLFEGNNRGFVVDTVFNSEVAT